MTFWESAAGHNLCHLMERFFHNNAHKEQYTKVMSRNKVGEYVVDEIKKGNRFIAVVDYNDSPNVKLVIMEK